LKVELDFKEFRKNEELMEQVDKNVGVVNMTLSTQNSQRFLI
jgi:hypothetical protein